MGNTIPTYQKVSVQDESCKLVFLADWLDLLEEARAVSRAAAERLRHALSDDRQGAEWSCARGEEGCPWRTVPPGMTPAV